jgi:hypothetical protein
MHQAMFVLMLLMVLLVLVVVYLLIVLLLWMLIVLLLVMGVLRRTMGWMPPSTLHQRPPIRCKMHKRWCTQYCLYQTTARRSI